MKIRFEFTVDDFLDVELRRMDRSRTVTGWKRSSILASGAFGGGACFLAVAAPLPVRLVTAGIGAVLSAGAYAFVSPRTFKRRMRVLYAEELRKCGPLVCEVETDAAGIHASQMNMRVTYPWAEVEKILETPAAIYIFSRTGRMLAVRDRAFAKPEERRAFTEELRRHVPSL
jgi:hypothetical protein